MRCFPDPQLTPNILEPGFRVSTPSSLWLISRPPNFSWRLILVRDLQKSPGNQFLLASSPRNSVSGIFSKNWGYLNSSDCVWITDHQKCILSVCVRKSYFSVHLASSHPRGERLEIVWIIP